MKIGSASELGVVDSSFTAICWVKNDKAATGQAMYKDRNPIFMGDTQMQGFVEKDFPNELFNCELRHQN